MGDTNEYQILLEPPTKREKANEGRRIDVIYNRCNKPRHSKECCHQNTNNPNNKLKDKNEVIVNGILAQPGGAKNKSSNKANRKEVNKSSSIIYCCFICNFVEHKIYHYLHKNATWAMFKEKATVIAPKKDDVVVNMVLVITTHN
jgi:hypothetical protein